MTQYFGVEVSQYALDTALAGRKIEAIRLVRDGAETYIGLKDAKDAVEAAMAHHDPSTWLSVGELARLRNALSDAIVSRDKYAGLHARLAVELDDSQREVRLLRAAISDHIFGVARLPDLSVERSSDAPLWSPA